MEIKGKAMGSSKAQLMSLTTLIFGLIIVSSLLIFVIINISYDSISQLSIISTSSSNIGSILQKSSGSFAYSSGSAALSTLYRYESNSSLRKSNFITNFSQFMQYLIVNGTIPGVQPSSNTANMVAAYMSNATFAAYNSTISRITGIGSKQITINETKPQIFQANPYSISITYTEYVTINTTTGRQLFPIPVSASIPINSTPDLFYAQQGIYRPVKFTGLGGLVSIIGNDYATMGSSGSLVYGTIYSIPSPTSCSISIPGQINTPPYNSQLIIATPNAMAITGPGCSILTEYGGLVTENITNAPGVPYLVFPSTSNALQYVVTGEKVLLYGPGMSLLDTANLGSAVDSGYYFASPFSSSYLQRASGNLFPQSPSGISTFSYYARLAPTFNTVVINTNEMQSNVNSYSIAAWVYPTSANGIIVSTNQQTQHSLTLGMGNVLSCGAPASSFFFGDINGNAAIGVNSIGQFQPNRWYFLAGTFNSIPSATVSPSEFTLYVNGVNATSGSCTVSSDSSPLSSSNPVQIAGLGYNGLISNVQIYNITLTAAQVYQLYENGMEGLPLASQALLGWYPLNGNASDLSGNGHSSTPSGTLQYALLPAYIRDSALPANASQYSYPIPGIGYCNNNIQCANFTTPHLYMNDNPLTISNAGISAAYFNGRSSYFQQSGGFNFSGRTNGQPLSISVWAYPIATNGVIINQMTEPGPSGGYNDTLMEMVNGYLYINIWKTGCVKIAPLLTGAWSNIALTYDGNNYYAYINGVAETSHGSGPGGAANSGISVFYPLGMANNFNNCGSGLPFRGMMSNYQLYNITLTQSQINNIYRSGLGGFPVATANVAGWWPLNGNGNDYSGNQNTGFGNSLSYEFITSNYSSASAQSSNSIGLSTVSGLSGEWQSMGLPARPSSSIVWNVTSWTIHGNSPLMLSYGSLSGNPIYPPGVNDLQTGSIFSGLPNSDQAWGFGTAVYRGANYFGYPATAFPPMLNSLNANVHCSAIFNTTGYTAITNMSLSGTYTFRVAADDKMAVFYRQVGSSAWTELFSGNGWSNSPPSPTSGVEVLGPVSLALSGNYQFVVDWLNGCNGGLSDFQMSRS